MIIRLWALAWAARYLKYLPIVGWRFSDSIVQTIEDRMNRDIEIGEPEITFQDEPLPTDCTCEVAIDNELPVDLTVAAVNLRIGYADSAKTVCNFLWSESEHGAPPANVDCGLIESGEEGTLRIERRLQADDAAETLHVDGTITTEAWLDVPSTRRIPLGTVERAVAETTVDVPK